MERLVFTITMEQRGQRLAAVQDHKVLLAHKVLLVLMEQTELMENQLMKLQQLMVLVERRPIG